VSCLALCGCACGCACACIFLNGQHNALSTKLSLYHQIVTSICVVSPSLRRLVGGVLDQGSSGGGGSTAGEGEGGSSVEAMALDEEAGEREGAEAAVLARCANCKGMCACEAEPKVGATGAEEASL
jgi:hypothetical protein